MEVAGIALLEIVLALQFGRVAAVECTGLGHVDLMVAELDALYLSQTLGQEALKEEGGFGGGVEVECWKTCEGTDSELP